MSEKLDSIMVWFRRDLRAQDHAALQAALQAARQVHCLFVFDRSILDPLPRADRRVEFILASVLALDQDLQEQGRKQGTRGCGLIVGHGDALSEVCRHAQALRVDAVFTNHDDEPAARTRDRAVEAGLRDCGVRYQSFKDHVIFERKEILSHAGKPYSVFTPYKQAWLKTLRAEDLEPRAPKTPHGGLAARPSWAPPPPDLAALGFVPSGMTDLPIVPGSQGAERCFSDFLGRIDRYDGARDFPAVKGPSYLSVHLRFGTLSIRSVARAAWERAQAGSRGAEVWLSELIWRDFYHQILFHHPHVVGAPFRPEYAALDWMTGPEADARFSAWCEGRTGYPLVDAAMLQLLRTGYMHNRLRMVTASFLVKDLGLDWRRGEAWFARQLNDFDLAANNGGWQWAASTGCDAQPYFRIFNPITQSERFDPEGKFIRRYLPQLAGLSAKSIHAPWRAGAAELRSAGIELGHNYPRPIVSHEEARTLTLARYASARQANPATATGSHKL